MLPFVTRELTLQATRSGTLVTWLGPALRGLTAARLKENVCRQAPDERRTDWIYCRGCPHMDGCAYGETFEPDPPLDVAVFNGQDDASRPLVLAPSLLTDDRVLRGLAMPVRLISIGQYASRHIDQVFTALAEAGRATGIGPDCVTYEVRVTSEQAGLLRPQDLPATPTAIGGVIRRVRVELSTPLFLRTTDVQGRRRSVTDPCFGDFFRASLRTIGQLYRLYAHPLPADFAALKQAAMSVRSMAHAWRSFSQRKWSNRTEQRFELQGVLGHGTFADVPAALLPWLEWGGRLHAGTHRVAGAGGWQVLTS